MQMIFYNMISNFYIMEFMLYKNYRMTKDIPKHSFNTAVLKIRPTTN